MADAPLKSADNRQEDGTFGPGNVANPNGRPKKGQAITDVMREMLEAKPEIKKALSAKLFELALGGDIAAIRELFNRLEGMPKQENEMSGGLEINTNLNDYRSKYNAPTETEPGAES